MLSYTRYRNRSRRILEASGYRVTPVSGTLSEWDLLGVHHAGMVLVRVALTDWPDSSAQDRLCESPAPGNTARLIHRWRAGARWPDVRVLL